MMRRTRTFSYRALLLLLLLALAVSLVPLLLLSRYAVPCLDDFSYGAAAYAAYRESGSVLRAVGAALKQVGAVYFGWQGTFSAVFLMSLQPGVFGVGWYALTTVVILCSLLPGLFALCLALFSGVFRLPRALSACVAAVAALLCVHLMPSPAQGIYWFNGGIYYSFFHGLMLLSFALALQLLQKGGAWRSVLLCLLAVLLGGSNYVTALHSAILAASVILLLLIKKDGRWRRLLLPALCLLAAFAVSMAAPGNAVRQASSEHVPNAVQAVLASFRGCAAFCLARFTLPVLGALLFLGLLLWPALRRSDFSFRFPAAVSGFSFCLLSAMFTPGLYALGDAGDLRLINIIFYAYILLLILNLCCWLGWLSHRLKSPAETGAAAGAGLWATLAGGCVCALCCLLFILQGGAFSSIMALGVLRSGEAALYRDAAYARFAVLEDESARDAVLEPYPAHPYILYFDDVTTDPQDWSNLVTAEYFGKDSVVLRES